MDAITKRYWTQKTRKNYKAKIKTINVGSKINIKFVKKEKSGNKAKGSINITKVVSKKT